MIKNYNYKVKGINTNEDRVQNRFKKEREEKARQEKSI